MPDALPKACLKYPPDQATLVPYSQNIHDKLLAAIATYPAPPVLPAALQTLIDDYDAALTAAILLGKQETANKNKAMFRLKNALRVDCTYVNQIIFNLIAGGTSYAAARALIISSGYEESVNPSPVGPMPTPDNPRSRSLNKGELYYAVNDFKKKSGLQVEYRAVTTPASDFLVVTTSRSKVTIKDLVPGTMYEVRSFFIGSDPAINLAPSIFQVVI